MGDTRGEIGVYKPLKGVRTLATWRKEIYSSWLVENVL